jgi:hypothetical protein
VWYCFLSIPWLSIAAINSTLFVLAELMFSLPGA